MRPPICVNWNRNIYCTTTSWTEITWVYHRQLQAPVGTTSAIRQQGVVALYLSLVYNIVSLSKSHYLILYVAVSSKFLSLHHFNLNHWLINFSFTLLIPCDRRFWLVICILTFYFVCISISLPYLNLRNPKKIK